MSRRSPSLGFPVFISHCTKDRAHALRVVKAVRDHGMTPWIAPKSIDPARDWVGEIGAGLKACRAMVVVLSKNAIKSKWVKREVTFAITAKQYDDRIVPLLVEKCKPGKLVWVLEQIQWIDAHGRMDDALKDVCRSLRKPKLRVGVGRFEK